jgi:hypothetical protein
MNRGSVSQLNVGGAAVHTPSRTAHTKQEAIFQSDEKRSDGYNVEGIIIINLKNSAAMDTPKATRAQAQKRNG